jgi:Family of unknown function (DUF6152)
MMKRVSFRGNLARAIIVLALAVPAVAHHSSAMFDFDKSLTLKGAVKDFQWTNPHCWVQLLVADNGVTTEWSVQMQSPGNLYRAGWRPGTLKVGDSITVVVHPMRDGSLGAEWVSAMGADGNTIPSSPLK